MVDTCVCCGAYVHEGRQVCSNCESEANKGFVKTDNPFDYNAMEPKRSFITRLLIPFKIMRIIHNFIVGLFKGEV